MTVLFVDTPKQEPGLGSTLTCPRCYALVLEQFVEEHDTWHEGLGGAS